MNTTSQIFTFVNEYLSHALPEISGATWVTDKIGKKTRIRVFLPGKTPVRLTILRPSEMLKQRFTVAFKERGVETKISNVPYPLIQAMKAFRFDKLSKKRANQKRMVYASKIQKKETEDNKRRRDARARIEAS